jgi:hypothetical protein
LRDCGLDVFLLDADDLSGSAFAADTLPKRLYEVDDVGGTLLSPGRLNGLSGRLALHQLPQLCLELIPELRWVEVAGLGVEDVGGEAHHLIGDLRGSHAARQFPLVAHLVAVAQDGAHQDFAERLDRREVPAVGEHDPRQCHAVLVFHGVTNDGERFLADLSLGHDVVRSVEIPSVDLVAEARRTGTRASGPLDLTRITFPHLVRRQMTWLPPIRTLRGILVRLTHPQDATKPMTRRALDGTGCRAGSQGKRPCGHHISKPGRVRCG